MLWATAPFATSYVSSQAVVNAPLNTVLSPMHGHIVERSAPGGTGVSPGAPLVMVAAEERDRRYLEELRARHVLLDESIASIAAETAELAALEDIMTARVRTYREQTLARLA